ncbi:hypothetical protein [Paracidovorax citrulli]
MPFGTFHPIPPTSPVPPPPGPCAEPASQPVDHPGIRLDALPPEILVHIGDYLPRNDVLSVSRGNRTVRDAVYRDLIQPLRLEERIRWINSLSEIHATLPQVLAEPRDRRARLLGKLEKRANALHPRLRGPALEALQPHLSIRAAHLPEEQHKPHDWTVLEQLACRVGWDEPDRDPATRTRSFDETLVLACRLPVERQGKVLAALARCMTWKTLRHSDGDQDTLAPRLARFVDHVRSNLPPADGAGVLGDLAWCGDAGDDPLDRPLRAALLAAAQGLPDAACARLLGAIVGSHPSPSPALGPLWLAAFEAAATVAHVDAAPLYEALASRRAELPEDIQERCWHALARRLDEASDLEAMLPALLGLADVQSRMLPDRRAELLRIGRRLPARQRATLGAAMVVKKGITPTLWRTQVLELAELPERIRLRQARKLIGLLWHYQSNGAFAAVNPDVNADEQWEDGDPAGLAVARFPRGPNDARRKASDLLGLLPLMDRGTILLHLLTAYERRAPGPAPGNWDRPYVQWLLEEALKLAPFRHNGINILTGLCRVVASECPNKLEARLIAPMLITAVRHLLPAENRACALFHFHSLMDRLHMASAVSWGEHLATLPAMDAAAANPNKRKRDSW